MSKSSRPKLRGIMTPQSHNQVTEQAPDNVSEQLRDGDIPAVSEDVAPTVSEDVAPTVEKASRRGRAKAQAVEAETKDYAHRSLYARPETLDLIRKIAFDERTSAQALYREGLLLMLQSRKHYRDKKADDV